MPPHLTFYPLTTSHPTFTLSFSHNSTLSARHPLSPIFSLSLSSYESMTESSYPLNSLFFPLFSLIPPKPQISFLSLFKSFFFFFLFLFFIRAKSLFFLSFFLSFCSFLFLLASFVLFHFYVFAWLYLEVHILAFTCV